MANRDSLTVNRSCLAASSYSMVDVAESQVRLFELVRRKWTMDGELVVANTRKMDVVASMKKMVLSGNDVSEMVADMRMMVRYGCGYGCGRGVGCRTIEMGPGRHKIEMELEC